MTQKSKRLGRTSQLIIPGLKPFHKQSWALTDSGGVK